MANCTLSTPAPRRQVLEDTANRFYRVEQFDVLDMPQAFLGVRVVRIKGGFRDAANARRGIQSKAGCRAVGEMQVAGANTEVRFIALAQGGQHATLGRVEPSADDIEMALKHGACVCKLTGHYHRRGAVILEVIRAPEGFNFAKAEAAFQIARGCGNLS